MLQLHLSDQQSYYLLRCIINLRFDSTCTKLIDEDKFQVIRGINSMRPVSTNEYALISVKISFWKKRQSYNNLFSQWKRLYLHDSIESGLMYSWVPLRCDPT